MSYWDGTPVELPSDPQFSEGPTPTFSEAFKAAYDAQTRGWSQFGLETAFAQNEQAQLDKLYQLTGERMAPVFIGLLPYQALAKRLNGEDLSPEEQQSLSAIDARLKRFQELHAQHLEIST
jgi:hypothetical protein